MESTLSARSDVTETPPQAGDSTSTRQLHQLLLETARGLRADTGQMALYDAERDRFVSLALAADGAIVDHPADFPREMPARRSGLFAVLHQRREPRLCDPLTEPELFWPGAADHLRALGSRLVQCIPLHFGNRFVGFMSLAFRQPPDLGPEQFEFAQRLAHQAAMAIELKRLVDAEQAVALERNGQHAALKRAAMLERSNAAMQQTVDLFGRIDSLAEAVPGVLRIVAAAFDASHCAYCEHPGDTIYLRYWFCQGQVLSPEELPHLNARHRSTVRRLAGGYTTPVGHLGADRLQRDSPIVVDHRALAGDVEIHRFCLDMGWHLELNIPLIVDGRAVGGLVVYRSAPGVFSDDELALGAALGKQLALAVQVTQRAEREREIAIARERAVELSRANQALRSTLTSLAETPDTRGFLAAVVKEVVSQLQGDAGRLVIHDPETDTLTEMAHLDQDGRLHVESIPQILPAQQLGALPIIRGLEAPRHFDVLTEGHLFWPGSVEFLLQRSFRSVHVVPLRFGGRFAGYLACAAEEHRPLSQARSELVMALAQQATLATELVRRGDARREAALLLEREQASRVRAAELERTSQVIQKTVDALTYTLTFDDFVPHVLQIAVDALGEGDMAYFEHEPERIRLRYWVRGGKLLKPLEIEGLEGTDLALLARLARGFVVTEDVLGGVHFRKRTRTLLTHRSKGKMPPEGAAFVNRMGWAWELNVPLVVADVTEGALVVFRPDDSPFTDADISLAEHLAKQIALAVKISRAAEREREVALMREQELATQKLAQALRRANDALRRSTAQLISSDNLHQFLEVALEEAVAAAGSESGAVFLWNAPCDELSAVAMVLDGAIVDIASDTRTEPWRAPLVFRSRNILLTLRARRETWWLDFADPTVGRYPPVAKWHREMVHGWVAYIPMLYNDQNIGFLSLFFDRAAAVQPDDKRLEICHMLTQQITLAVRMAQLSADGRQAAVLSERARIAAEIHDSLAQSFTSIAMQTESLRFRLHTDPAAADLLRVVEQTARQGLAEARASVMSLDTLEGPPGTIDLALAELAERCNVPGSIACRFGSSGQACDITGEARESLMRVAREAVHNAMRHSGGTQIDISLDYREGDVVLTVEDDGAGLPGDAAAGRSGFGLQGMKARVQAMGGQLRLAARQLGGTCVEVRIPCGEAGAEAPRAES